MRTTVTLDPLLAKQIKDLARHRRASFKATLNEVLRRGLSKQPAPAERFVVEPHSGGFRTDVDPGRLNQLVDELEVDVFVARQRERT
jgi:hypothetical protein